MLINSIATIQVSIYTYMKSNPTWIASSWPEGLIDLLAKRAIIISRPKAIISIYIYIAFGSLAGVSPGT